MAKYNFKATNGINNNSTVLYTNSELTVEKWQEAIVRIKSFIGQLNKFINGHKMSSTQLSINYTEQIRKIQEDENNEKNEMFKDIKTEFSNQLINKNTIIIESDGKDQEPPEITVVENKKEDIRALFESIDKTIYVLPRVFSDHELNQPQIQQSILEIEKFKEGMGYKMLKFIAESLCNIPVPPPTKKPVAPNESDVKFIFTRHAFSCNNLVLYNKVLATAFGDMNADPSVLLYGILQAHFKRIYDNNGFYKQGNESRQNYYSLQKNERVYVSGLVRTWQTAVILYLPNIKPGQFLELEVLPFIKEKDNRSMTKMTDVKVDPGNYPAPIQDAIIKFKRFLEYLSILSKDIRDLYIGGRIKLHYLDLIATFEIKEGGNTETRNDNKEKYKTNYGPIPDVNYNKINFDLTKEDIKPTAYFEGKGQNTNSINKVDIGPEKSIVYRPYVKVCLYNKEDNSSYSGNEEESLNIEEIKKAKFSETLSEDDILSIRDYEVHTLNVFKRDFIEREKKEKSSGHLNKFAYLSHGEENSSGGAHLVAKFTEPHRIFSHNFRFDIPEIYTFDNDSYTNYESKSHEEKKELLKFYGKNKSISTFIKFYENNPNVFDKVKTVRCLTHSRAMQEFISPFFKEINIRPGIDPDKIPFYSLDTKKKRQLASITYIKNAKGVKHADMLELEYQIANHNVWDLVVTYNTEKQVITSLEIRAGIDKPIEKEPKNYGLTLSCETLCKQYDKDKCYTKIPEIRKFSQVGNSKYISYRERIQGGKKHKTRKLNKKTRKTKRNKKRNNKRKTRHRKK